MKFKIGEMVRLKRMTYDEFDACDTNAGFLLCMLEYVGEPHEVKYVHGDTGNLCLEAPNGQEYYYSPNWIEPLVKFKGNK